MSMSESHPADKSDSEEDKLKLFGNLVKLIESVLSPKPINVWHLPGALQRIVSSIILIICHGSKDNSEEGHSVWSFIFGLRVIRPDLWPTYELKLKENSSGEQLVLQWLELSLQSHIFYSQLKALLNDGNRLQSFYYDWAFLRTNHYVDSFLIVIQALEQNSQDVLATLNPSLMVKYYSKRKKEIILTSCNTPSSYPNKEEHTDPSLLQPGSCTETLSTLEVDDNYRYLDGQPSKLSPSFFKVDYNNSLASDGEKTDAACHGWKMKKESCGPKSMSWKATHYCSHVPSQSQYDIKTPRRGSLQERNSAGIWNTNSCMACSASTSDIRVQSVVGNLLTDESLVVKPSPFLIKYLSSKSKLCASAQKLPSAASLEKMQDNLPCDHSLSSNNLCDETKVGVGSPTPFRTSQSATSINEPSKSGLDLTKKAKISLPNESSQTLRKYSHARSQSDGVRRIVRDSPLSPASVSYSEKSSESSQINKGPSVRKRFMEDGGQSITPEADGFFPHPQPGQDLIDFLASDQFAKTSAQLDRENAHFNIAEAVLAAIEQMNCETCVKPERKPRKVDHDESEDDGGYQQKLSYNRRRLRIRSSVPFLTETSDDDPVTTDHSIFDSPETRSPNTSDSESGSQETKIDNEESDDQSSLSADPSSAENVAIAILMHYNSKLLPKASELQWLVSEQEAPQKLLPMPNSVPVSPDDAEETLQPLLRGTSDWAPPRPQLILTLHKNEKRKARMITQKWRCAGCGLLVSEKLSSHFRLCHYLGRYFCTSCHSDKKAVIPANVLHKWHFKKYAVCNFSSELLSRMSADPLFHLGTLNPKLYKQSRDLHQTLIYRLQLFHARIYIFTCSKATKIKAMLEGVPVHWFTEPHVYSLDDLLAVKEGQIVQRVRHLTTACVNHISSCQICLGQGFICEICREGSPIFPFQLDAVTQCTKCKGCFHFLCFSPNRSCPRCERRERREGKSVQENDR